MHLSVFVETNLIFLPLSAEWSLFNAHASCSLWCSIECTALFTEAFLIKRFMNWNKYFRCNEYFMNMASIQFLVKFWCPMNNFSVKKSLLEIQRWNMLCADYSCDVFKTHAPCQIWWNNSAEVPFSKVILFHWTDSKNRWSVGDGWATIRPKRQLQPFEDWKKNNYSNK